MIKGTRHTIPKSYAYLYLDNIISIHSLDKWILLLQIVRSAEYTIFRTR